MLLPIYESGEVAGQLQIRREGLYTVFEARLPPSPELTRLWVAGGPERAYLGVMEPKGEGRVLRRRLSGAELRSFPMRLEYACTKEPPPPPPPKPDPDPEPERRDPEPEPAPAPPEEEPEPEEERHDPPSRPPPPAGGSLQWQSRPDGSLVAFDGRDTLLALPARLRHRPPGLRLAVIGGREYLVFRT